MVNFLVILFWFLVGFWVFSVIQWGFAIKSPSNPKTWIWLLIMNVTALLMNIVNILSKVAN